MYQQLSGSGSPTTLLAVADMCLDAATQSPVQAKDHWVDLAELHLDEVEQNAALLRTSGLSKAYKGELRNITSARLRKSELANWRRAAHGRDPQEAYREYLSAATHAVPWLVHDSRINSWMLSFCQYYLEHAPNIEMGPKDGSVDWHSTEKTGE
jgi:hypothetical protein